MLDATPKRTVLKGLDNWIFIFLGKGSNGRDYSFNDSDYLNFEEGIQNISKLCHSKSIQFYSAIVPEKFNIYPEKIKSNDRLTMKIDKYFSFYERLNKSPVDVVFFHNILLLEKQRRDIYYKTDTHWNSFAGFLASNHLFRNMSVQFKDIIPFSEKEFLIKSIPTIGRDIGEYLSLSPYLTDTDYVFYPEFNQNQRRNKLKILVLHDSYFYPMVDFFKYQFGDVETYNFVQNEKSVDFDLLLAKKPDIVLFILLERHIGNYDKRVYGHLR
ncbi:alginate biosynthesis protein [Leptospira sp. WS39.C2]